MAEPFELDVGFNNRFKATRLRAADGRAHYGLWRDLKVQIDGDEEEKIVQEGQEGQLDLFAEEAYGEGERELWHVIAQANKIDYPPEQVVPGLKIIIPKPEHVRSALLKLLARQQARIA